MAMALAAPDGVVRADTITPSEDGMANTESDAGHDLVLYVGDRKEWRHQEPRISDVLADPIVYLLMRSDGVTKESVVTLLNTVRPHIAAADPQADPGSSRAG
jgi:hypothetical protein